MNNYIWHVIGRDELPDVNTDVLVTTKQGDVEKAHRYCANGWHILGVVQELATTNDIKAWTELPEGYEE